jgi:hypothetical protein
MKVPGLCPCAASLVSFDTDERCQLKTVVQLQLVHEAENNDCNTNVCMSLDMHYQHNPHVQIMCKQTQDDALERQGILC